MLAVAKTIDFPVNHVCNHAKRREFVLYTCQVGAAVHIYYTIVKGVADRAAVTTARCVLVTYTKIEKQQMIFCKRTLKKSGTEIMPSTLNISTQLIIFSVISTL